MPLRNQTLAMDDDGHSVNVDIQMMGGIRDDKEDLLMGLEELFGRSANTPINLAVDGDGDVVGAEPDSESIGTKRNRSCTSDIWVDYEKIYKVVNGKKVRFQAKCFHCGKIYFSISIFGIGTLKQHKKSMLC